MKRVFSILGASFLLLASAGCVRRIVTIDSQPQGAQIYFDRKLIGQTPYTHEFLYYGAHRLELVKKGYDNVSTTLKLKGPLYEYFPISIFTELIIPWKITNEHKFAFELKKGKSREPVISSIEKPQPDLSPAQLERIEERAQ